MSGRHARKTGPCEGGTRGCTGTGTLMIDPLASEVDGVDEEMYLCEVCARSRADDA